LTFYINTFAVAPGQFSRCMAVTDTTPLAPIGVAKTDGPASQIAACRA
jgi:hypothetical protein